MAPISFTDRSNAIFGATISWYQNELEKVQSPDLVSLLKKNIQELEGTCSLAASYFRHSDDMHRQRIKTQQAWKKGLQEQLDLLDKMIAERPAPGKATEIQNQYETMISTQKGILAATTSNIQALQNLWHTENRLGFTNREDMLKMIQLFVSLDIDRSTYQKLADSARTVVGIIPDISIAYTIINGTYDLAKIWMAPPSFDSQSADKFLLWLGKRREMLLQVQQFIKAFGIF